MKSGGGAEIRNRGTRFEQSDDLSLRSSGTVHEKEAEVVGNEGDVVQKGAVTLDIEILC